MTEPREKETEKETSKDAGLEALYAESLKPLESGTIVRGVVVDVNPTGVMVDIGYKSEGVVPAGEFSEEEIKSLKPGDDISVFIVHVNESEGIVSLSKERARNVELWDRLEDAFANKTPVEGSIVAKVKGGMSVDIGGETVFLPGSHISLKVVHNMDEYLGLKCPFRVIKINKHRRNAIVSRRILLEEDVRKKREQTIASLKEGAVIEGTVKNITDYGVFVDLGGIDGLLHISDISWGRIKHPSEKFSVGDSVSVEVLSYNRESGKVALGYKKTPDPWISVNERYSAGDRVKGIVRGLTNYGIFVEIEEGVEGLVHVSELVWGARPRHASELFSKGDTVEALVLKVDSQNRRISLSMKRLQPNPWETVHERYHEGQLVRGRIKNLTDFGAFVGLENGIDGLIHVSDMSWTKHIRHPSEILKKGDEVEAMTLSVEPARERIALGLKQLSPDPWLAGLPQRLKVGDVFPGRVIKMVDFGIFVEIEDAVEGLVYSSEIDQELNKDLREKIHPGDVINVRVIKVDANERKIGLSIQGMSQQHNQQ